MLSGRLGEQYQRPYITKHRRFSHMHKRVGDAIGQSGSQFVRFTKWGADSDLHIILHCANNKQSANSVRREWFVIMRH